jgi:hypothetical protein
LEEEEDLDIKEPVPNVTHEAKGERRVEDREGFERQADKQEYIRCDFVGEEERVGGEVR